MAAYSLADILGNTQQLQPTPRQVGRDHARSARSRNRAGAWAYDLAAWREYRLATARTDRERQAIEAEYLARLEAGPDFASHRSGSDFSEPPLHQLDGAERRKMLAAFDAVREWQWRNNRKAHGQGISLRYREILRFLLNVGRKYGRIFPALATIAQACSCSVKTVCNALAWLAAWGFLSWKRRLKRVPTGLGMMVRQTSNAYRIALSGLAAIGSAMFSRGAERNHSTPSRVMGFRWSVSARK